MKNLTSPVKNHSIGIVMLIAHLSDLHLCSKFKPENIHKTERIIERGLEQGVNHFVFTGDISDNADVNDYKVFRDLLKNYDLLHSDKSSVVIGNHDIFGGVRIPTDVLTFPSKCKNTDYETKLQKFVESFRELFENVFFPLKDKFFPYAKNISDTLIIGLNSIDRYSKLKNPFASNGKVDREQRKGLKMIFEQKDYELLNKILLIHHHFYKNNIEPKPSNNSLWDRIESFTMKLRGKKKLVSLLHDIGINFVLHGHSHEVLEYSRRGLRFLNAGGVIDNGDPDIAQLILLRTAPEQIYSWTENIPRKTEGKIYLVEEKDEIMSSVVS